MSLRSSTYSLMSPVSTVPLFTLLLSSLFAMRGEAAEWSYKLRHQGGRAYLVLQADASVRELQLSLTHEESGQSYRHKRGRLKAGRTWEVKLPKGRLGSWKGALSAVFLGTRNALGFSFEIGDLRPLTAKFITEESDLRSGRLTFQTSRPVEEIEGTAFDDEGAQLWTRSLTPTALSPHRLSVTFELVDVPPRRLDIKLTASGGAWVMMRIAHWYAEIPHEEINFASGSATLTADQRGKVDQAIEKLRGELDRYRRAMGLKANAPIRAGEVSLYIAGYTDRVGDARANERLSRARAASIAAAFRAARLSLPIYSAGFGERGSLVQTADHVAEARNRRATYILSTQPPSGSQFPDPRWSKSR
ncbi:MAG: OmpA family protein [Myxococcota bacterium]|nr:OmpA family protein [Myxococcota bacterium]